MRRRELLSSDNIELTLSKYSVSFVGNTTGSTTFTIYVNGEKYTDGVSITKQNSSSWVSYINSSGVVTVNVTTNTSTSTTRSETLIVSVGSKSVNFGITQDKNTSIDGHLFVDMGNGLKWCAYNVGANAIGAKGKYYQWGAGSTTYNSYQGTVWYTGGTSIPSASTYDTAHAVMGGGWRMPTKEECRWLINNCLTATTTINGSYGMKYTSKINSNYLFFPYQGYYKSGTMTGSNSKGPVWTNVIGSTSNTTWIPYTFWPETKNVSYETVANNGLQVRGVHA